MSLELMCIILFLIMVGSMILDAFLLERIELSKRKKEEGKENVEGEIN